MGKIHPRAVPPPAGWTESAPRWKEHDASGKALERLRRDLKVEVGSAPDG